MKYKDMTYAEFVEKLRVYENDCPACENDTQDFCDNYCEYNSKRGDCLLGMIDHAADAIERLVDEIDRKDKALQAFLKQIEQMIAERKKLRDTLIESICVNCDTPPDVRLRVCGECPIIQPIREVFDE